jgi:O-antigen ligase
MNPGRNATAGEITEQRSIGAMARLAVPAMLFVFAGFYALLLGKLDYPQSWYDHQRVMQLAGITLSVIFLPFLSVRIAPTLFRALVCICGVLLVVMFVHGAHGRPVVIESLTLALLVIAALWWSDLIRTFDLGDALLLAAQVSIAWYTAISMFWLVVSVSNGMLPDPFMFFDGFVNPRLFGAWVTLSWPLLLLQPRTFRGDGLARLWLLPALLLTLAAFWWSLALFSGTRAAWLAALVLLGLTAALGGPAGRRIALRGVLVIAAGCLLHQLLFVHWPAASTGIGAANALDRLREGASLSQRDVIWGAAWRGIVEQPWFGAGPMMFSATGTGVASSTHNVTLQLAYEWGVPFALLVIAATVRVLWRQFERCRSDADPTRLVLWMCVVGGLIEAQLDGLLVAPHSQLMFAVLCAWLMSLDPPVKATLSGWRARAWSGVRFLPLLMALALWLAVRPELSRLEAWELESLQKTRIGYFQPRFWLQGVIFPEP